MQKLNGVYISSLQSIQWFSFSRHAHGTVSVVCSVALEMALGQEEIPTSQRFHVVAASTSQPSHAEVRCTRGRDAQNPHVFQP